VSGVSELVIRGVDPHDVADMDAFQQVYDDAERAQDPDAPLYSRADAVWMLTSTDGGFFADGLGAFQDGEMVGEALVNGSGHDASALARVWIWVSPDHTRRGIGSALLAHAESLAVGRGRQVCQAQVRLGADGRGGNLAFAERHDYTLANSEVERRLPLPVDPALLDRLDAEAAPHHREYEIRTVVGPVPDDLAASYVALKNRIGLEMPQGELDVEEEHDTVEMLAAQDRDITASGRTRVASYAVDRAGDVVGYAVAAVSNDHHQHVDQWGTLVHSAHRGHRLGMAVKVAETRALNEQFAHKRFVTTTNAETNSHMVAINEALGFTVSFRWADIQKRLA
jgi:GNAT superfamily N-acetyltransferase